MQNTPTYPGTVSKILWHFTGGPVWDARLNKQGSALKSHQTAYVNLKSILRDRNLKKGSYREVVNVILPLLHEYDRKKKEYVEVRNRRITLTSANVCCLADIPIQHLTYHAMRYGKFTIGFHREAAVRNGFNPVLYTLPTSEVIRQIYQGLSSLEHIDASEISSCADDIGSDFEDVDTSDIGAEADAIQRYADSAMESLKGFLAFAKTFEPEEFNSIYCEREWRSVNDFKFTYEDVAMVVLPKKNADVNYYSDFLNKAAVKNLPKGIPVVPWEDLVEH
jgi:hypothetical protein